MILPYTFRPEVHKVIKEEPHFMGFLRREFPDFADRMFLYRHATLGNFVVAGWVNRNRRRILDMLNLGQELRLTKALVAKFKQLWCPRPGEEMSVARFDKTLAERETAADREHADTLEEMRDLKRHVYKKYVRNGGGVMWEDVRHKTLVPQRGVG